MANFTNVEAAMTPGITHSLIPLLCIHRIQRLPMAVPSASCTLSLLVLASTTTPWGSWSYSELKFGRWALKRWRIWDVGGWLFSVVNGGEEVREEVTEITDEFSKCRLAEISSRCRRGVGEITEGTWTFSLYKTSSKYKCYATLVKFTL